MITQAQADYMARTKLISNNYTKAHARVDRARRTYNLAPTLELYAKYIKALSESEQATGEYYSRGN